MILSYLQNSTNHTDYPILISSDCVVKDFIEIYYCIRKHPSESFFSVTFVYVYRETVSTWIENDLVSLNEARDVVEDIIYTIETRKTFKRIFAELLKQDSNIVHVTPDLTILYVDKDRQLKVSRCDGFEFFMPGFVPSQSVQDLFQKAGGTLNV